ncbi:hypothetical protein A3H16_00515 [Candidatus Kaiserbacteria bacterium RIFCSPLOWO2_12_FULL_53_8]|uniref:DUF5671 domain-containing protein n=2 Tax=Candidatus Kaiseribacteriota TaxID=1752734 RepID=A0A1F6CXL2_9BACT|nr:MAG: hypothetical protein A2851_03345 [Candidatus Kaiserbacteria bacterium RIFCSPHIGHO2_01_FULL_53_29]OGG92127.1 MAG: hypothetical protein A3H16_00515 [Candidatus Kaiserbacteria bacterium RIFCSPLOWO2_12_FULL_53_8]
MDKTKVTPKDFVLWVGAMVTLYAGVIAFINLIFDYINHAFPNPVTDSYSYYSGYSTSVSYEMAALIVLTPVFLILMRVIRNDMAHDHSRREVWVRRWALFLTLFLAGATMVVDLIILLNTFLQGEDLTTGFLLKVLTVLLVTGLGFMHFLADLRGYWDREPMRARMVNYAVGAVVLITIIAGFFILGTPQQMREKKQDAIRVQDLQNIQYQIVNYWQQKEKLPVSLAELNDPITNNMLPVDPQTKAQYSYETTGKMAFKLCATFANAGDSMEGGPYRPTAKPMEPVSAGTPIQDSWQHGAGEACFERIIDPERYPPYPKTAGF